MKIFNIYIVRNTMLNKLIVIHILWKNMDLKHNHFKEIMFRLDIVEYLIKHYNVKWICYR